MADRDYTKLVGDTTSADTTRDYTKLVKPKPLPEGQELIDVADTTNVVKVMTDVQDHLLNKGYSQDSVDALLAPVGHLKSPMALDSVYKDLTPVLDRNMDQVAEALKTIQALEGDGFKLQPRDKMAITSIMERYSSEVVTGLSDMHKWWRVTKRQMGDKAADFASGSMLNLTLGMALLDGIDHFDKTGLGPIPGKIDLLKAKIPGTKVIPKETIEEIENRAMPTIVLDTPQGEKEFDTGFGAGMWVLAQKVYGFGERTFADLPPKAAGQLSKLFGNEPLSEFFTDIAERTNERGEARGEMATGQIPPLVGALGEPSSRVGGGSAWLDIVERKLGIEHVLDRMYRWMDDHGAHGDLAMAGFAGINAGYDTVFVPSTVAAAVIGQIPRLGIKGLQALGAGAKIAEVATDVGRSTRRLDDALDSVTFAQGHYDDLTRRVDVAKREHMRATGEAKVPMNLYERWIAARQQLNTNKQLLNMMKDPTADEMIMLNRRRNPKLLKAPEKTADDLTKELHKDRVEYLEQYPGMTPDFTKMDRPKYQQRVAFGADDTEQASRGMDAMIRTNGDSMDDIMVNSSVAPEYSITPASGPIPFINWEDMPTTKAIAEAEQRFIKSISGRALPEPRAVEPVGIQLPQANKPLVDFVGNLTAASQKFEKARKLAIKRNPKLSKEKLGFLERRLQQQALEEAGLTKQGLKKVLVQAEDTPSLEGAETLLKAFDPHTKKRVPIRRLAKALREILPAQAKAEKLLKLEPSVTQAKFDPKISSLRMLVREENVIRKNLGVARQTKNTKAIKIHTDNLNQIRKVIDDVDKRGMKPETAKYTDNMFPAENKGIMDSPSRFNRWLNLAGDRVVRSLYPGAMRTGYWDSLAGQIHSSLREPQRFWETANPEVWKDIRGAWLRFNQSANSYSHKLTDVLEKAGVMKLRSNFNPKKDFHPYSIEFKKGEELYDLLNMKASDEGFQAARKAADPAIVKAHDEIRSIMDTASELQGLKGDDYLEGYIHHVYSPSTKIDGARPVEFAGMSTRAEAFISHLQARKGNDGYQKDVVAALELYGRAMHKKLILDPMYDRVLIAGDDLYRKTGNPSFKLYANTYVRQMQGKPSYLGEIIDRTIGGPINAKGGLKVPVVGGKEVFGKKIPETIMWKPRVMERKLMGLSTLFHMSMLGGNSRYPFMQIATAIPTTASRFGMLRTLKGIFKMGTREGQALAKNAGVYQPFVDMMEAPEMRQLSRFIFEKIPAVSPFGVMTNAKAEMMARGMTFHASVDMLMTKAGFSSWDEAVEAGMSRAIAFEGLRMSEEVNHMFGAVNRQPLGTAVAGQGVSVASTQFLSFIWKQTDELLSQATRDVGMLGRYLAVSGWASKVSAEDLGIDATNYVGLGYIPTSLKDATSPTVDFVLSILDYSAAHAGHNPEKIARTQEKLLDNLTNVIPAKVFVTGAMKAANRMKTEELRDRRGNLQRKLDFAGLEGLDRFDPPSKNAPGLGPEAIPTLFMQKNIREEIFNRTMRAARAEDDRFAFNQNRAINNYIDAEESGDEDAANELRRELANTYKIRISGSTAIERAKQARSFGQVIRYIHPRFGGTRKMMDVHIETLQRFGVGPTGEQ